MTNIVPILKELDRWHHGETSIAQVCLLLGDNSNELGRMLMVNDMADFQYKPMEGFSYQAVVNAVLLYLAMRYGIKK